MTGSSDVTKPTLFLWAGEFGRRGWLAGSSQAQPSCFLLCLSWQRVGIQGCSRAAAGMAACRLHRVTQHLRTSLAEPSSSVSSGGLVYPTLCKYINQKLYRKGLACFPEGLVEFRSTPHHRELGCGGRVTPPCWCGSAPGQSRFPPAPRSANSQPQKGVSIVLWHWDKMKSKDSTLVSGSSFPCSL